MAALPRSTTSFRRQGSSGLVWEDRFLSGELNKVKQKEHGKEIQQENNKQEHPRPRSIKIERSRSNGGGRAFHSGKVTPAIEPPSPKVSACGFCGGFGKPKNSHRPKSGKRKA